jgi:hypothetical protein
MASLQPVLDALWQRAMDDPVVFLFGDDRQAGLVTTVDEHDHAAPVKPLPNRPHLLGLTRLWEESHQLVIAKSRQMMVSWWGMAMIAWEVMHPGRRWAVTCRKFDDADALLERMWGILQRIPKQLRPPMVRKEGTITVMHPDAPSQVLAVAQDSDAPRSRTFSGIWVDEAAFTDDLNKLYAAAKPTVMSGGRLVMVSSPNGRGLFYDLLSDHGRLEL